MRDKYEGATEVKVSRRGKLRLSNPNYSLPTAQDLVYLEDSPNYCVRNESMVNEIEHYTLLEYTFIVQVSFGRKGCLIVEKRP